MTDLHQVIDDLQDRDLLGALRGRSGDNLMYSCPFVENHGGKTWQKSPSFGIRDTDAPGRPAGSWNCFSCHAGSRDIADLWSLLTGQTAEEAEEQFSQAEILIDTVLKAVHKLDEKINLATECLTDWPTSSAIDSTPLARDYLLGRGIPAEMWTRFGLEWFGGETMPPRKDKDKSSVRGNRVIFPIWWGGRRIGYSSRAVGYETDLKYYRPVSNMQTLLYDPSDVLLGDHKLVFVVEGEMDCLACIREGLPAVGSFGSGLTRHQAKTLSRFRQVVFLYDADKAGIRGVARIQDMFGGMLKWRALWLPKGEDPASMPPGWGKRVLELAAQPAPDLNINQILSALKGI
jgi:DNA primase